MRQRTQRIKFISVKLPACGTAYPLDNFGCRKLPNYTTEYLRKRARILHNILRNKVPGTLYSELLKLMNREAHKGKSPTNRDMNIYTIKNRITGEMFRGTRKDMTDVLQLSQSRVAEMVKGIGKMKRWELVKSEA